MQKKLFIPLLAMLALSLVGCENLPFLGGGAEEEAEAPNEVTSVPTDASPQAAQPSPKQAQAPQTTEIPKTPKTTAAAGLIASTDPNKRETEIRSGRPDPFSSFPARVTIKKSEDDDEEAKKVEISGRSVPGLPQLPPLGRPPVAGSRAGSGAGGQKVATGRSVPGLPQLPPLGRPPAAGSGTGTARGSASGRSVPGLPELPPLGKPPAAGQSASGGSGAGGPDFDPELPKIPEATAAKGVKVTGVIQIKGVPHAIVQAPGQESRYVKAGDYLANGQVLVKRIDMNKGGGPVVVLVEKGVEVVRRIGEGGVTASANGEADGPEATEEPDSSING